MTKSGSTISTRPCEQIAFLDRSDNSVRVGMLLHVFFPYTFLLSFLFRSLHILFF
jgi:hypothetical protein